MKEFNDVGFNEVCWHYKYLLCSNYTAIAYILTRQTFNATSWFWWRTSTKVNTNNNIMKNKCEQTHHQHINQQANNFSTIMYSCLLWTHAFWTILDAANSVERQEDFRNSTQYIFTLKQPFRGQSLPNHIIRYMYPYQR